MKTISRLVFATNNPHKLEEARQILSDKYEIISLGEIGCHDDIEETSETLEGNALIKARYIHDRYGCDCFADDTGLMVDSLNGAPGVYSARYAGENCTPADNVAKLLEEMNGQVNREAHFSTVVALILDGKPHTFEGRVEGRIARHPSGKDGFGYDPVFIEKESGKTFAEMTSAEKNAVSHRGRALRKLSEFLGIIMLMIWSLLGYTSVATAEEWRLVPSYDGQMVNIVVSPDYVYFLGAAQEYNRNSSNSGILYGNLFRYDIASGELNYLNSQNLLTGNIVKAIGYNYQSRYLAVALDDGVINLLYDNGDRAYIPGLSIADASLDKTINDITFSPDRHEIYAATNFGYIVIDDKLKEIKSSRILNKEILTCARFKDRIWLGNKSGLYYGTPDAYTFTDFSSVPKSAFINKIHIPGEESMIVEYGDSWNLRYAAIREAGSSPVFWSLALNPIYGSTCSKDYFVATSEKGVTVVNSKLESRALPLPSGYTGSLAATFNGSDFWFSSGRQGISCLKAPSSETGNWTVKSDRWFPDASNVFMSMSMAYHPDYGMLVRNHGYEFPFADHIFNSYDVICGEKNLSWTPLSTTYRVKDGLLIDNPWGVAIDPVNKDHIYSGSVRSGLFRLDLKNPENSLQFSKPADLYGNEKKKGYIEVVPANPQGTWQDQCVFAAPSFDNSSNLWTIYVDPKPSLKEGVSDRIILCAWTPEARTATRSAETFQPWKKIEIRDVPVGNNSIVLPLKSSASKNIVLAYGNINASPLLLVDHRGTLDNTSDDRVVKMKNIYDQDGEMLTLNIIYSWHEDLSTGLVWVGYNDGIFTFDPKEAFENPSAVRRIKVPRNDGTNLADYLLSGVKVNSITTDGSGRKWFGTQGAGLVCTSADGKTIYNTYTTDNSQMPGNLVFAVEYNPSSNSMMVSTDNGLCELFISSGSASSEEGDIRCFPNPVRPDYYGLVTIDGLADDAMVKIVDTAGNLIKECGQATAGSITWNITDIYSRRVPGGVYFVMAGAGPSSDSYNKVGKILVVE
ncbi:MAG: RdgB/HAM1 family non-canonical purine NTP pyrophosphatase [Muribaculaceae bacterium]|nr:RdgB/HAM1 family non-canonical purine NTP pyrophosphatase [Muribaculaceae bacterium]